MKPVSNTSSKADYLFNHIILGFVSTFKGIIQLRKKGMLDDAQYTFLLEETGMRIISRIDKLKASLESKNLIRFSSFKK